MKNNIKAFIVGVVICCLTLCIGIAFGGVVRLFEGKTFIPESFDASCKSYQPPRHD